MRTVSYKCDRCGKPMTGRSAVKITVSLQRGVEPAEKISHDFCQKCFVKVKKGFALSMSDDELLDMPEPKPEPKPEAAPESKPAAVPEAEPVSEMPKARLVSEVEKSGSSYKFAVETGVLKPALREQKDEAVPAGGTPKDEAVPAGDTPNDGGILMGPLSKEEHALILKLHVEEGLDADAIAAKLNRLPRGIKRCINTALKTGVLDRMKAVFAEKKEKPVPVPDMTECEEPEPYAGSGVSNAGIMKDGYTAPPQTEAVDGKRYDVGAILALARARWSPKDIASEKHYDEDVVRMLLEKYMG